MRHAKIHRKAPRVDCAFDDCGVGKLQAAKRKQQEESGRLLEASPRKRNSARLSALKTEKPANSRARGIMGASSLSDLKNRSEK
jgi:hypothetical protein